MDSPLEGGGFELPVPRADGTQDTALHGGNTGSNPVGDANPFNANKNNELETVYSWPLYRLNVYFLYRAQRPARAFSGDSWTPREPAYYPRTSPPSIGITAPVT